MTFKTSGEGQTVNIYSNDVMGRTHSHDVPNRNTIALANSPTSYGNSVRRIIVDDHELSDLAEVVNEMIEHKKSEPGNYWFNS